MQTTALAKMVIIQLIALSGVLPLYDKAEESGARSFASPCEHMGTHGGSETTMVAHDSSRPSGHLPNASRQGGEKALYLLPVARLLEGEGGLVGGRLVPVLSDHVERPLDLQLARR